MRVLHLSTYASSGGAARAARRIHEAVQAGGITSDLLTADEDLGSQRIHRTPRRWRVERMVSRAAEEALIRLQATDNPILHSAAVFPSRVPTVVNEMNPDVVQFHWVNGGFLSVEQIGRLMKGHIAVWTMHDMWPICGAEHYESIGGRHRYREGYRRGNRDAGAGGLDVDLLTWVRKKRSWRELAMVVCPSQWLAACVRESALMADWPVQMIPNPLNTQVFRPLDKTLARGLLNIPLGRPTILFGAIGGTQDPRKGWDLLRDALPLLNERVDDLQAVVLGQDHVAASGATAPPVIALGQLSHDLMLALAYSAADCVVVPSRIENLPQVATEAQSCGTPVVAFDSSGAAETVEHLKTGYLAEAFSVEDLAAGIEICLADSQERALMGPAARERAVSLWSYPIVARQYRDLYFQLRIG